MPPEKFAEIESDSDPIDSNKIGDVLDVIDVTIERRFFFVWANKDGVNTDHTATHAYHFDLVIADVPLHIIEMSGVCVRHDDGSLRQRANFLEANRIDVRQVEQNAEPITFGDEFAAKSC